MMAGLSKQGTRSLSQIAECVQNLNSKDGPFQLNAEEIEGLMKAVRCWLSFISFYFFRCHTIFFFMTTWNVYLTNFISRKCITFVHYFCTLLLYITFVHNFLHTSICKVPTMEDAKAIKIFVEKGEERKGMGPADLLILELARVPNLKQRLSAMQFRGHLPTTTEEIDTNLDCVCAAINEVKKSVKFKKLLAIMLAVGNQINAGTVVFFYLFFFIFFHFFSIFFNFFSLFIFLNNNRLTW